MSVVVASPIRVDDAGVAWIEGTTTKVIEVVLAYQTSGLTVEALQEELPHLSMAQLHGALSYYHARKPELDEEIARRRGWADRLREQEWQPLSRAGLRRRLRGRGAQL